MQSWICLNTPQNAVCDRPCLNWKDSLKIFLLSFPLRQGLIQPSLASNFLCAKDDLEFLILLPPLWCTGIRGMCWHPQFHGLSLEPRALSMLGKHPTNWATPPALKTLILQNYGSSSPSTTQQQPFFFYARMHRVGLFLLFELFPQEKPGGPALKHKLTLCFPTNG